MSDRTQERLRVPTPLGQHHPDFECNTPTLLHVAGEGRSGDVPGVVYLHGYWRILRGVQDLLQTGLRRGSRGSSPC
jgi:hypothetical protein